MLLRMGREHIFWPLTRGEAVAILIAAAVCAILIFGVVGPGWIDGGWDDARETLVRVDRDPVYADIFWREQWGRLGFWLTLSIGAGACIWVLRRIGHRAIESEKQRP
jgi:hypothetical protein